MRTLAMVASRAPRYATATMRVARSTNSASSPAARAVVNWSCGIHLRGLERQSGDRERRCRVRDEQDAHQRQHGERAHQLDEGEGHRQRDEEDPPSDARTLVGEEPEEVAEQHAGPLGTTWSVLHAPRGPRLRPYLDPVWTPSGGRTADPRDGLATVPSDPAGRRVGRSCREVSRRGEAHHPGPVPRRVPADRWPARLAPARARRCRPHRVPRHRRRVDGRDR